MIASEGGDTQTGAALPGVLVVEIASRVGGGVAGSLLAQLGATVILVELPERGGSSAKARHRAQFAAGKLSLVFDPSRDQDLLRQLVSLSDVVITSSDIDGALIAGDAADRAVMCDITAYGHTGTLAGKADSDRQIQAVAGIAETTGMSDGPPVIISFPVVEFMTGVYAASAILTALRVKAQTGAGQSIDMTLYDCAFASMATFLPRVLTGDRESVKRIGNRHTMIAPWNVYRAQDGWILVCVGNDAQWRRFCETAGKPELGADPRFLKTADRAANSVAVDAIVQSWVQEHSTAAGVATLTAIEIACGPVAPVEGHPREPNLAFRGMIRMLTDPTSGKEIFGPASALRMSASPGRSPGHIPAPDADRQAIEDLAGRRARDPVAARERRAEPKPALAGLRIVEIGHYTTVPLSTRMLASLGAEVIKIEPPEGEATRDWPPLQNGQGYFFTYMNSDKSSVTLDLRKDDDAETLRKLLKTADVLIENLKPGALARRGFSPERLAELNPRLIYCAVSGFGAHSLYSGRPAYDTVIQAMSGMMDIVRSDGVPVKNGISTADLLGAEFAVLAVLAALAYRDRTGRGQAIDLSMQDIAAWATQTAWNSPNDHSAARVIRCRDGYVVAEADDERLRRDAHSVLAADLASSSIRRKDLCEYLERRDIMAAPIMTVHEVVDAPHTQWRQLWFDVTDDTGTWPLLANPMRLTGTAPVVGKPMPTLGRDNDRILRPLSAQEPTPALT